MVDEELELSSRTGLINATDFEMWIRMATDNKINAKNSWNFELIDYFYDLSLLREGTNINFQKASATLDGCVKIYSSRVDSAATETGKLLSGLTSHTQNELNSDTEDNEVGKNKASRHDENDIPSGTISKLKQYSQVSTLVSSFNEIKAKKIELELNSDPIFKKTLTLFDEGGAKSLLLNMLNIDNSGLVVFGSGKDSEESRAAANSTPEKNKEIEVESSLKDRINKLGDFVFANDLELLNVCPSMHAIRDLVENDSGKIADILNFPEKDIEENEYNEMNFEVENEFGDFFDDENDARIGETSMNVTLQRLFDETLQMEERENNLNTASVDNVPDYDLLLYFDRSIKRSWDETKRHWKVVNLIKKHKVSNKRQIPIIPNKKERAVVDFFGEDEDEDELFGEPVASISLPKNHRIDSSEHCLVNDIDFTAKRLIHLFNKEVVLKTFRKKNSKSFGVVKDEDDNIPANELYWSQRYKEDEELEKSRRLDEIFKEDLDELHQSYHHSFFQDEENDYNVNPMGDENFDGLIDEKDNQLPNHYIRPTYINFSKVAKKVDIKLLKSNLWNGLNEMFENIDLNPKSDGDSEPEASIQTATEKSHDLIETISHDRSIIKFSELIQKLDSKYGKEERKNISTSFCFICLLHLANEHSFTIENNDTNDDLLIRRQSQTYN